MEQKQQMHALHLGQRPAVAVALSLLLLIVGVIGLGMAMVQSNDVLPNLNVSLGGLRIVGYTTEPIPCRSTASCAGPSREYRVIWAFYGDTAPDYVQETWHRLLNMPLQR